jgi:hypothetical protein
MLATNKADKPAHQVVTEGVERALVGALISSPAQTVADGHIGLAIHHRRQEVVDGLGRVGVVGIDQHIITGVDIAEGLAHHVALALAALTAHHRAGLLGEGRGLIRGIIVVDIDGRAGELSFEVAYDLSDGDLLVVGRQDDGYLGVIG